MTQRTPREEIFVLLALTWRTWLLGGRKYLSKSQITFSWVNMCRNIKPLYNFEPPTTDDEIRAAAIQFVRKISGFNKVSAINETAFEIAVDEVTLSAKKLLDSLITSAPAKSREIEREKAKERNRLRFRK